MAGYREARHQEAEMSEMSEAPPGQERTMRLREQLTVLRARKWSIMAVAGLALAAALVLTSLVTPVYSSTARVLVKPPAGNLQGVPPSSVEHA